MPTDEAGSAESSPRRRVPQLLRPVGRSRWGMAVALALALGAILATAAALDRGATGSAVALGFVLTAVPSLPPTWREALAVMSIRATAVLLGAGVAILAIGHPVALGAATVTAAMVGALMNRVGPTAGLAVVLVAVDVPESAVAQGDGPGALASYAAGAGIVVLAWATWFACSEAARGARGRSGPPVVQRPTQASRPMGRHAARVGIAVAAAVLLANLLPDDLVGGHWLVTSVLLTVQPAAADTGMRLAQRLSGNAVGALIAAVLLGARPGLVVVAVATVVLFTVAMALRPVNYTWWAVTGPPVLLMISEYPALFPWYEGGVRLLMNLAGATIVLLVIAHARLLDRWAATA